MLSAVNAAVFASDVSIVAKVNQIPITSFDVSDRRELLSEIVPNFEKYSVNEQNQIVLQNLIQDALRHEYAKKTNFKMTDLEKASYYKYVMNMLKLRKVKNVNDFAKKHPEFIATEVLWRGIMEKNFMPYIKVSDEIIAEIKRSNPNTPTEQIREALTAKQLEAYSTQVVESIRKISIIDVL